MIQQDYIYLGCNQVVYQSKDKKERLYELRQILKTEPFVYLYWVKGPGQQTLIKGRWYCFKNYKIVSQSLRPITTLYQSYKVISKYKQGKLNIESMRDPYSNILGVIQEASDLDEFSRRYPFRIIKILLVDGTTVVEMLLKNRFATERQERFQSGEIIYIYGCKRHSDPQNDVVWYSSLTNNTKIKFDPQSIRLHVEKTKFEQIVQLKNRQIQQDEATGQIE